MIRRLLDQLGQPGADMDADQVVDALWLSGHLPLIQRPEPVRPHEDSRPTRGMSTTKREGTGEAEAEKSRAEARIHRAGGESLSMGGLSVHVPEPGSIGDPIALLK